MLFMTSKKTVDRGQAQSQSATTTSKRQTAVNTLIDTFMKQLRQGGIIIAVISGIRRRYYCG
jgi:protein-L-isoaspartate O-methyltransferase